MERPPRTPHDFRIPRDQPSTSYTALTLVAGLAVGSLVSLLFWVYGWRQISTNVLIGVPAGKLVVGIICFCFRRARGFGAGLLLSLAAGLLIFFGACASNFKF